MAGHFRAGARVPAINELLLRLPPKLLDSVCSEEHLLKLTEHFSEWINISTYLGLTKVQQKDIEFNWPRDLQRQRIEMFAKWKEKKKEKATYRSLVHALHEAKRNDVIDELSDIVKNDNQETSQSESPSHQTAGHAHNIADHPSCDDSEPCTSSALSGVPSLRKLSRLHDLSPKWYYLGLQLKVRQEKLEVIDSELKYGYNDKHLCMVKMFGVWLRECNPSYQKLIKVLRDIGEKRAADSLIFKLQGNHNDSDSDTEQERESDQPTVTQCSEQHDTGLSQSSEHPHQPPQISEQPTKPSQNSKKPAGLPHSLGGPVRPSQSFEKPTEHSQSSNITTEPPQSSKQSYEHSQSSGQPNGPPQSSENPAELLQSPEKPAGPPQSTEKPAGLPQSSGKPAGPPQSSEVPAGPPHSSEASPKNDDPLPKCVVKYADYLKRKYKRMSTLPNPKWPPSVKEPVKLALIERKADKAAFTGDKEESFKWDYAHGKIDNIIARKKQIEFSDVFEPNPNRPNLTTELSELSTTSGTDSHSELDTGNSEDVSLKILMDGAPGVGKTTLTRKACIDWANGKILKDYHLVVLVPLREARNRRAKEIDDLLPCDSRKLKEQVVEHIEDTSGKHVLLIFDGFDELSAEQRTQESLFLDVINGDCLSECTVLVTSRPYASGSLQRLESVNRHIEVLGFTEEQIRSCIMCNMTDRDQAETFVTKLQERLDIASLCYIPLNCAILMYVYVKRNYTLPSTLTSLYSDFVLDTLKRHAISVLMNDRMEKMLCSSESVDSDLTNLPKEVDNQLAALCKLAYHGLVEDKFVFTYMDLCAVFPNTMDVDLEFCCLGLLTSVKSFASSDETVHYQFLHLSIQEFLAARYVASTLTGEEQLAFFDKHIQNVRYRLTLLFLAGITKLDFPSSQSLFQKKKLRFSSFWRGNDAERFLFLGHLVFESRNEHLYNVILQSFEDQTLFSLEHYDLTLFDCMIVAHFLCSTGHAWKELNFLSCSLTSRSIEVFKNICHDYPRDSTTIIAVDMSRNKPDLVMNMTSMPWLSQTQKLILHCRDSLKEDSAQSIDTQLACLFPIKDLNISVKVGQHHCECRFSNTSLCLSCGSLLFGPGLVEQLMQFCSSQKVLTLDVQFDNDALKVISAWLTNLSSLKTLFVCNAAVILQSLEHNATLEELHLSRKQQEPGNSEAVGQAIEKMLHANTTLKVLHMQSGTVNDATAKAIAVGLTKSSSLERLNVDDNILSDSALAEILSSANASKTLCHLRLHSVEVSRSQSEHTWKLMKISHKMEMPQFFCVLNISSMITQITELDLSCTQISGSRVIDVFQALECNTGVEVLDLSENSQLAENTNEAVCQALVKMLHANTTLKVLHLHGASVNDTIAKAIAAGLTRSSSLEKLNVDDNTLSDSSIAEILSSANANSSLYYLHLSGVQLSRPQSQHTWKLMRIVNKTKTPQFFCALNQSCMNIRMTKLDLSSSLVTFSRAMDTIHCLEHHTSLEELDLSGKTSN